MDKATRKPVYLAGKVGHLVTAISAAIETAQHRLTVQGNRPVPTIPGKNVFKSIRPVLRVKLKPALFPEDLAKKFVIAAGPNMTLATVSAARQPLALKTVSRVTGIAKRTDNGALAVVNKAIY